MWVFCGWPCGGGAGLCVRKFDLIEIDVIGLADLDQACLIGQTPGLDESLCKSWRHRL